MKQSKPSPEGRRGGVPICFGLVFGARSARGHSIHFYSKKRFPRARVPLVVWAWDLVVIRLLCCGLPAPARRQFFALRFVTVCDETYLSLVQRTT